MKLAYADPPYIGQAKRHYNHDPSGIPAKEVDHVELIHNLIAKYDGWALSASSPSIPEICSILSEEKCSYRIAAWVKTFCSWKPTHRVQYTWEPVFFVPVRDKGSKSVPSVRDFVSCRITTKKGTHGAKPDEFNDWIINLLGYQIGDSLVDLYPGTCGMADAIKRFELFQENK